MNDYSKNEDRERLSDAMTLLVVFFSAKEFRRQEPWTVAAKPVVQRYFDVVLKDSKSFENLTFNSWIATWYPELEGFKALVERQLRDFPEFLTSGQNYRPLYQLLDVVEKLPNEMRPNELIVKAANAYIASYRSRFQNPFLEQLIRILGLEVEEISKKLMNLNQERLDSTNEFFKLIDGKVVFRVSGEDEPVTSQK